MLEINSVITLSDNEKFLVENELLFNGQIYYVLSSEKDNYNEKIFIECVEYDDQKYLRVVEDEAVYISLNQMVGKQ